MRFILNFITSPYYRFKRYLERKRRLAKARKDDPFIY